MIMLPQNVTMLQQYAEILTRLTTATSLHACTCAAICTAHHQ